MGWSQSKQPAPTQVGVNKNQVRYAAPRQGNALSQNVSALQRFGSTAGTINQNFNHYRRQNSYRKGQKQRVDSAKGGRGLRQSMEGQSNPAYRLINQQAVPGSTSDHQFVGHG